MRGLFTTLFAYAVGRVRGEVFFDGYANHRMAVRRAFFGSISSIFINAATKMVKLSVFTVVSRAKGLIYIYLGVIILGNKFSWTTVAIGVVSIFGITLVVSPGIYGFEDSKGNQDLSLSWSFTEILGLGSTFCFMIMDSLTSIALISMAGSVGFHQAVLILHIGITLIHGAILSMCAGPITYQLKETLIFIPMVLCFYVGHIFFNEGCRLEKNAGIIGVLQTTIALFSMILECIFMGARVSLINAVGCLIVFTTSCWAVFLKEK